MCVQYAMEAPISEFVNVLGPFDGDRSNLDCYPEIFPNYKAPIIRRMDGNLTLDIQTWGIPHWEPKGREIVNVRNLDGPFWRNMLRKPEQRCLVPVTKFCEWTGEKGNKRKVWFAMKNDPLFAFAGIWRTTEDGPRYAFLTCEPNSLVKPFHQKAMPVMLPQEAYDKWLAGDTAVQFACPFPPQLMNIL